MIYNVRSMENQSKNNDNLQLLEELRIFIAHIRDKVRFEQSRVKELTQTLSNLRAPSPVDVQIRANTEKREKELERIYESPFFTKCILEYPDTRKVRTLFFGKHQFADEEIYSWVAPIASIRFERPGDIHFTLPSGEDVHAKLVDKEQYMIVDGRVIFFAKETETTGRKLIYHDYFSSRKGTFELPEIVAIMEKAQDAVIRAHHVGSFAISGPAGSGKTTLAFHRIACLLQSPDTTDNYSERTVVIFVQDAGAKEYFSHLLPNLGINNVKITTFFEWAFEILELTDVEFISHFDDNNIQNDLYEYEKIKILKLLQGEKYNANVFLLLQRIYEKHFSEQFKKHFSEQKKSRKLDRVDLTIVLSVYFSTNSKFESVRTFNVVGKNGEIQKKKEKTIVNYSLMLIDEFQNYLPEQLQLLGHCVSKKTKSIIYVGDINQQVRLGTINSFEQIGEKMDDDRNVVLHKVYRNTKQILGYIRRLGYKVEIPENIKEGLNVVEKVINTPDDVVQYVSNLIQNNPEKNIGVLSKDQNTVKSLKSLMDDNKQIHISTMIEAQGVEFDIVCLVGEWDKFFNFDDKESFPSGFIEERERINKDLLYVALTRAVEEMHVIGDSRLSECSLPIAK